MQLVKQKPSILQCFIQVSEHEVLKTLILDTCAGEHEEPPLFFTFFYSSFTVFTVFTVFYSFFTVCSGLITVVITVCSGYLEKYCVGDNS